MRRLKVLMLNHGYRDTGSFFRCSNLARELVRAGLEVLLVTVAQRRRLTPCAESVDGLTIVESPNLLNFVKGVGAGYGVLGIPYRMLVAARERFDLVHAFEHKPNVLLPAMLCRASSGCPLVADWSDWWGFTRDGSGLQERKRWPIPELENTTEEFIHLKADQVTTISTGLRDRAIALGIPAHRIRWIPSGAPIDVIRPLDRDSCRRALGIPPSIYMIGYVGTGLRELETLADVLLSIREKHPKVKVGVICPRSPSSSLSLSRAQEALLDFGPVPFSRLNLHLGACDAFVLPNEDNVYNRTRWPNKFGDYLAAGRPVLCSNVGDVPAIVKGEGCGMVWDDVSELSYEVEVLMDDVHLSSEMGERSRRLAEGRLSWQKLAQDFIEVYGKVGA